MSRLTDTEDAFRELTRRVDHLADVLHQLDTGGTFETMTCGEIEALADVLRCTGRTEVVDFIIGQHAEGDDEGDQHYEDRAKR